MAPAYANIFMGRLENQLLMSVTLKPFSWLRFIDDIDMKRTHGRDSLEDFLQRANSFHPTIKFTAEVSNEEHIFLDTKSCLVDGRTVVDLYTKPTDTHQYLLPSSCHPKHCSKNIPYSLALRLRHICTDTATFALRSKELTDQLRNQDYQMKNITVAVDKASQLDRQALLSYRVKPTKGKTVDLPP